MLIPMAASSTCAIDSLILPVSSCDFYREMYKITKCRYQKRSVPNAGNHPRPNIRCMRVFVWGRRVHWLVRPPADLTIQLTRPRPAQHTPQLYPFHLKARLTPRFSGALERLMMRDLLSARPLQSVVRPACRYSPIFGAKVKIVCRQFDIVSL